MTGKETLPAVTVPRYRGESDNKWFRLYTGACYFMNNDEEPLYFAFGDTEPTHLKKEDGHRMYPNEQYVNDAFDTIWIHRSPTKDHRVSLTKFGDQ